MKTLDIVLVIVGTLLIAFTIAMIVVFCRYGSVPDTLVTCFFAALGGECGVCGWIKTTKERHRERQWQLEDEKRMEDKIK